MISELFSSLAAPVFAAMLFLFLLKRRSREINRGEANNDAAANNGTAGGASGAHTPTGVPEMATSSGPAKDAAANDGTAGGDSGAHTSTGVPEMATSTGYDYEVFWSFRGPDTREGFTYYLYTSLTNAGIRVFKDDEDLRIGEEFATELLQAIKQSKILIPIFSKNYASSIWCLKEVVQMIECKKTGGQKIMPIFYDVAPAEVRHQTGGYGEAFRSHEKKERYDEETMRAWKAALKEVSFLNGWDLQSMPNRREGAFTKQLTEEIFRELKKAYLVVSDCLVSVDNHVNAIMGMIGAQTNETRIVGIHGMGGIGKTTTAKIIYNWLSENFEGCCFLSNIREMSKIKGIECLQNQLVSDILKNKCTNITNNDDGIKIIKDRLSNKRVLLILDDVHEKNHTNALVGERDWLGKGSKLIVTTRNKEALDVLGVDDYYELTGMDRNQYLQLFSRHAFRRDSPLDEYIDLSNRAIDIAGGLPLALEVIGSLLSRTEKKKWDFKLKKLGNVPHVEVQSKLRVSYDALDIRQQHIFLDVACLLIGYDKDIVVHFWDESKYPEDAMEVLQNMSLIKITKDNQVWMHDQLRDLGREIVHQKSEMKIEKKSRVWDPEEELDLLRKHKGKKEIEALRLNFNHEGQYCFTYEGFESLSNLRFLEVVGWSNNFRAEERLIWHESPSNVLPTNENSDLLPHLRWLSWCDIPLELNVANFFIEDVVILNLSRSAITHDWEGWSHMKVMKNLKILNLSHCIKLKRLPDSIGNLESLIELDISTTSIDELPSSFEKLKNLKRLKMMWSHISKIPDALWTIEKLEEVEAYNMIGCIHGNIGNCINNKNPSLRILQLFTMEIYSLPRLPKSLVTLRLVSLKMDTFPDLSNLTNLKELDLRFESRDSDGPREEYPIPRWMGSLSKLKSLRLDCPCVTTSPTDLSLPPLLRSLYLDCPNLRCLPRLPSSLSSLHLYMCKSLCSMESLDLSSTHLKWLHLTYCTNLCCLPRLPSSLSHLELKDCKSLCSMEDLSNLKNLSYLKIMHAAIEEIQGLGCLEDLRDLELSSLRQVKILPNLSNLNKLTHLDLLYCDDLVEIQGELPQSLEVLGIRSCKSLQKLPDLLSLNGLRRVTITRCTKLNVEEISSLCLEKAIEFEGEYEWVKRTRIEDEWYKRRCRVLNIREKMPSLEYQGEDAESESEYEGEDNE